MNGLIVASALAMGRGSFHYSLNDALTENGDRVLWAEYAPEKVNGKKTCVYLMKIRIREVTGINYGYSKMQYDIMWACVIALVLITVIIQSIGNLLARRTTH
mgnify:CR=1 FL=1